MLLTGEVSQRMDRARPEHTHRLSAGEAQTFLDRRYLLIFLVISFLEGESTTSWHQPKFSLEAFLVLGSERSVVSNLPKHRTKTPRDNINQQTNLLSQGPDFCRTVSLMRPLTLQRIYCKNKLIEHPLLGITHPNCSNALHTKRTYRIGWWGGGCIKMLSITRMPRL